MQYLKSLLRDHIGIPVPIVLAFSGCLLHLALVLLLRKPLTSPLGLLGPLVAGIALEGYEIFDHYRTDGLFAAGADPLYIIIARHSTDLLAMLAVPVLIVGWGLFSER